MKRKLLKLFLTGAILVVLVGIMSVWVNAVTLHKVTFDSTGGSVVAYQKVVEGKTVKVPNAPTLPGCTFAGWYTDIACTSSWNFTSGTVTRPMTLYAKWTLYGGTSDSYITSSYMQYKYLTAGIDIRGSGGVNTTYNDNGYEVRVGNDTDNFVFSSNMYTPTSTSNVYIARIGSFINNGKHVKMTYLVQNRGVSSADFKFAVHADVKIGDLDSAPVTAVGYSSGSITSLTMANTSSSQQFNLFLRDAYGVTNISTVWIGVSGGRQANLYNNSDVESTGSLDSGIAFSWRSQTINAGETKVYSVLLGVGASAEPSVVNTARADASTGSVNTYTISGGVTNPTPDSNVYVNAVLYDAQGKPAGGEQSLGTASCTTGTTLYTGNYSGKYTISPDVPSGTYTLKVYTVNSAGATSRLKDVTIYYNNETVTLLSVHEVTFENSTVVNSYTPFANVVTVTANNVQTGTVTRPSPDPTCVGYTFGGWYKEQGCTTLWDFTNTITTGTTIYAKWTPITYTVKYANVASITDVSFTYDGVAITLPTPTKTGYIFTNWSSNGKTYNGGASIDGTNQDDFIKGATASNEITLTANWTANTYTVQFNANGGSSTMSTQSFTYDVAKNLTTNAFTRVGYTFTGWDTQSAGTNVVYADNASVQNLTAVDKATVDLYAVWTANTYTVTFDANSGTGNMTSQDFIYDQEVTITPNAFTKTGYHFTGWTWNNNSYADGATIGSANQVTFITGSTNKQITLTATWVANTYTVIFNTNGGSGTAPTQSITYDSTTALTTNSFARAGYEFLGWDESSTATTAKYANAADGSKFTVVHGGIVQLYAIWNALGGIPYTVEHYQQDLTGMFSPVPFETEHKTGVTDTPAGATVKSYIGFTYFNQDPISPTINGDGSTIVRLYYARSQYTILFHAIDSTAGTMAPQILKYDQTGALTPNAFVRNGYDFIGWSTSAAGTVFYTNGQTVLNLCTNNNDQVALYAVWTPRGDTPYKVEYYQENVFVESEMFTGISDTSVVASSHIKNYVGFDCTNQDASKVINGDGTMVLQLYYVRSLATLSFDSTGGTAVDAIIQKNGSIITPPQNPTRDGYSFDGWFMDKGIYKIPFDWVMPINGVTVYAKWTSNAFPPIFNQVLLPQYFNVDGLSHSWGTLSVTHTSLLAGETLLVTIQPKEGYEIADVLVNGKSVGAVESFYIDAIHEDMTIYAEYRKIVPQILPETGSILDPKTGDQTTSINPFSDVNPTDSFYQAVQYLYQKGLLVGISPTEFGTDSTVTRAMFVTILGRQAGIDESQFAASPFKDVDPAEWYSASVEWATKCNLVLGYGENLFYPLESVTQEQMYVALYKYAAYMGCVDKNEHATEKISVQNKENIADWAIDAIQFAQEKKFFVTTESDTWNPKAGVTRSEFATVFFEFYKQVLSIE